MPRYFRKIIKIRAIDSPNVRLALAQQSKGIPPTNEMLVPGVLSWEEYLKRRATWDAIHQTIGLDAEFYEGKEVLLYPPQWLNLAEQIANKLRGRDRKALGIGIDPGEGVANTSFSVVDDLGLIEQNSRPTPDTSVIVGDTIAFMNRWKVPPDRVCIDRGGGGKQIADQLRKQGYHIRTIAFGESVSLPPKHGSYLPKARKAIMEERYTYFNRRAQMYGELRILLDPSMNQDGFGIPAEYTTLRKQMAPIPLHYGEEGRMWLPPKHRKPGQKETGIKTLEEILGASPDELDSFVLAIHAMLHEDARPRAGVLWS